ncbi:hypothetical protein [Shewanella algae]|uniref:hypothetical protein n=1 Tax=Shewanella algae TaxID=38313 RepID=UPI001F0BAC3A|nr:hypothetical protein [Shewanella algae]
MINRNNLIVYKPEKLGQNEDAGGQRTLNPIRSGILNELFRAISDVDHAEAAIDIAKAFPSLVTQDTATLRGAHVFWSSPPQDPLVNLFLVESPTLDDASRMPEMVNAIESSVTAGSLFRSGAPGFLPNQNSFSREYLESIYMLNGKEYVRRIDLRVGQIIAISTEYEGQEDKNWPRRTHYAMVTETNAPGNNIGNIVFDPPIDFATPEHDRLINGEANCTKLRLTNSADNVIFHGVTKLTAPAASGDNSLAVKETKQQLLPAIVTEQTKAGIRITAGDNSIVRKIVTTAASGAQSYSWPAADVLQGENQNVDYQPVISFISGGVIHGNEEAVVTVGTGEIAATLTRKPDLGSEVSCAYISSEVYQEHMLADPLPQGAIIAEGSFFGNANEESNGWAAKITSEKDSALYSFNTRVAIVDYEGGIVTFEQGYSDRDIQFLIRSQVGETECAFNLNSQDPLLDSLYIQVQAVAGSLLSASGNNDGTVTGAGVNGTISNGLVTLTFDQPVNLSTLTYDLTERVRLLPPPEMYGLNPLRIPGGGQVDIFRKFGTVSVQHSNFQPVNNPQAGQTLNVRQNARFVDITDADGLSLWTVDDQHFEHDKETGVVTIKSAFPGFTAPFILSDTIGELAMVTGVSDNSLLLAGQLKNDYQLGATVSSILKLGELESRIGEVRDMTAWDGNWDQDGAPANGSLNVIEYPIEVVNESAVNEDWALVFTGSGETFKLIGRGRGQVATGDTLNDFIPNNPATGLPFFIIRQGAFGGGWQPGEAARFQQYAASKPVQAIRSVQSGHSQITDDKSVLSFRGTES